jgi:hypothetical protein
MQQNTAFIPFPSIGQFRDAVFNIKALAKAANYHNLPTIKYVGKVKLHGTNAAICFDKSGSLHCQSREKVIYPGADNAGFAAWAYENIDAIKRTILIDNGFFSDIDFDQICVFGEWCGGKTSPNVALSQLPKMFVVFAIAYIHLDEIVWVHDLLFDIENEAIQLYNTELFGRYDITIDFADPGAATAQLEEWTLSVEDECPAGAYFGVKGIGEGIVFMSANTIHDPLCNFKSKGLKHKAATSIGSIDPIAVAELSQLIDLIMRQGQVENRVEQGVRVLRERGHAMESTKDTLLLVDWLRADIKKENLVDIEASTFPVKKVMGACLSQAKIMYKAILDSF